MGKQDDFAQVLGGMVAGIDDKVNSAQVNRQVVEALHKDYRDNFQDDPDAFVTVGPTAPTAELQEIYKMMPQEMRDDVDDVWGTRKPMYVRKDMITLVFGQRKFSVSQLKKQEITDEEGYELIKLQFQKHIS